jgi:hypothetical protein
LFEGLRVEGLINFAIYPKSEIFSGSSKDICGRVRMRSSELSIEVLDRVG